MAITSAINVGLSIGLNELLKKTKKKVTEQKKMEQRPKLTYDLKEAATIGDLKCDVVVERELTFASEVTENPVEDGFAVADHVSRKPLTLNMTVLFTPTPVTWFKEGENYQNRLTELQKIYKKGEPVTIKLVDAIYKEMLMTNAPLPRNVENGYCYSVQISFVQVRRVNQKTESLPNASQDAAGKNGATETDGGKAETEEIGTGITVIDNTATTEINTANISKGQAGDIKNYWSVIKMLITTQIGDGDKFRGCFHKEIELKYNYEKRYFKQKSIFNRFN